MKLTSYRRFPSSGRPPCTMQNPSWNRGWPSCGRTCRDLLFVLPCFGMRDFAPIPVGVVMSFRARFFVLHSGSGVRVSPEVRNVSNQLFADKPDFFLDVIVTLSRPGATTTILDVSDLVINGLLVLAGLRGFIFAGLSASSRVFAVILRAFFCPLRRCIRLASASVGFPLLCRTIFITQRYPISAQ